VCPTFFSSTPRPVAYACLPRRMRDVAQGLHKAFADSPFLIVHPSAFKRRSFETGSLNLRGPAPRGSKFVATEFAFMFHAIIYQLS
jgi:hypothetical protein